MPRLLLVALLACVPFSTQAALRSCASGADVQVADSCLLARPSSSTIRVQGFILHASHSSALPWVYAAPGIPTAVANASGVQAALERVVLANFSLGTSQAPAAAAGQGPLPTALDLLWPQQLTAAPPGVGSRLSMTDVRIILPPAELQRLQPHLSLWKGVYTDNSSFVHIVKYEDATATLLSVTLLTPDTLDNASSSDAAAATAVMGTTGPRLHTVLMQHAGLHTQRPLLLFLTSNITLDPPEQAPANSSYPVNRPVYFIGLISSKTSIDFRRTPNQLNLTGSGLGRVYFLSVALENQGYGDAYTTWYSGLYSPLILHNMWGVLVDRLPQEVRLEARNCTFVVPDIELSYLVWSTSLYASPLAYAKRVTGWLRKQLAFSYHVAPGPGDALTLVEAVGRTRSLFDVVVTTSAQVVPEMPLPPSPIGELKPDQAGPQAIWAVNASLLQAAIGRQNADSGRDTVVLLSSTISLNASSPGTTTNSSSSSSGSMGDSWPEAGMQVVANTLFTGIAEDAGLSFAGRPGALQLPDTAQAGMLRMQGITLTQLPLAGAGGFNGSQGDSNSTSPQEQQQQQQQQQQAGASAQQGTGRRMLQQRMLQQRKLLHENGESQPEHWTLLVWGVTRPMSLTPSLTLTNVTLALPAHEMSHLRGHAQQARSFLLTLSGGLSSISLQDVVVQGPNLLVGSMSGPGMSGTNLTLVEDPASPVAPDDWGTRSPSDAQARTGVTGVPVAAIVVPAVLATALVCVSGAWAVHAWRKRRQHPADAKGAPLYHQQACPEPAGGADTPSQQDQHTALVVSGLPSAVAAGHTPLLKLGQGSDDGSSDAPAGRVSSPVRLTAVRTVEGLQALKAAIAATSLEMLGRRLAPGRLGSTASSALTAAAGGAGGRGTPPPSATAVAAAGGDGELVPAARRRRLSRLMQAPGGGSPAASRPLGGVQLHELLGQGSFGCVYKGMWHGKVVAVKIVNYPAAYLLQASSGGAAEGGQQAEAGAGSGAGVAARAGGRGGGRGGHTGPQLALMEAALAGHMQHPNVVQVYTWTLEPLTAASDGPSHSSKAAGTGSSASVGESAGGVAAGGGAAAAAPGTPGGGILTAWELRLIMEYCGQGSLRQALDRRPLHLGRSRPCAPLALCLAHDVACALLHLHSEGIIHGDVKAANVLLACAPGDVAEALPRRAALWRAAAALGGPANQLTAKVADFGLAMVLPAADTHATLVMRGTMTHMAPELLLHGHVSKASDVYAFGILLWEMLVGARPYPGVLLALLPHEVAHAGLRPAWPAEVAADAALDSCRALAEACWAADPAARPSAEDIILCLDAAVSSRGLQDVASQPAGRAPQAPLQQPQVLPAAAGAAAAAVRHPPPQPHMPGHHPLAAGELQGEGMERAASAERRHVQSWSMT